ncbi:MAG: glycine C-acetyltransferase [Candidatus Neomarinimicrobiota bacterium]|nr:glycine C-acetyltransferase [Candidatus Neomarinimicrobiota bacterium]MED5266044.1 glycine C-acetyltransferase [Candidatus Neomarinimicrobiota bacterium]
MIKKQNIFIDDLAKIKAEGLYKNERTITTPQGVIINTLENGEAINFCSNNYLGLSNNVEIKEAAKKALEEYGFGMSSVRFICGTQQIHKILEEKISKFFGTDDSILYTSCFDANGGLFETLLGQDDAIISDELNHASIIDGIRLSKAKRYRFNNNDIDDLELILQDRDKYDNVMIATDGVFSMDGHIAKIDKITKVAEKYNAIVMVDDSHATGFVGKTGRGSAEHCGVMDKVDIWTSTFGKALGGASGGFTTGKQEIIDLLRQRSRPYLFSNTVAPSIVAASIKAFDIISSSTDLRDKLEKNTIFFREEMTNAGFNIKPGIHPIIPIMINDAVLAQRMAELLLNKGIYVVGFFYPVVPKGQARIRVQISAEMEMDQLAKAISIFTQVGQKLKILK